MVFFELIFDDQSKFYWFIGQNVITGLLVIFAALMLWNAKKSEGQSQKEMFFGFGMFAVICLIVQAIFLFFLYTIYSGLDEPLPRPLTIGGTGFEFLLLMGFALGFAFLLPPVEKYILDWKKKPFSKMSLIAFIMMLIPYLGALAYQSPPMDQYWTLIAYPGVALFGICALFGVFGTVLIYLKLGIKSTGTIKKKGFLIGIGMALMYFALIAGSEISSDIGGWTGAILNPGVMIIGTVMVLRGHQITQ